MVERHRGVAVVLVAATVALSGMGLAAASAGGMTAAAQPVARVLETPTPQQTPCAKPTYRAWTLAPERIAAGDEVVVSGAHRDLCLDTEPSHDVRLLARPSGAETFSELANVVTGDDGRFRFVQHAATTTTFRVVLDGQEVAVVNSADTVVVDRVSGSCRNAVTLYAPSTVEVSATVQVRGTSSDSSTVSVAFRKRGQTAFTVRRHGIEPAGQQGVFMVAFTVDDDYRLYASNDRCDSPPILVTAAPVIAGPASVRKGSTVTLTVRATPGMPLAVAFRRAGQTTFSIRRTGTANSNGIYTTTYRADDDHQYYAAERPGQQSIRKTTQAI